MFFDASLASSAFPSEKQGAPRGIPLSVLSKEKARQGLLARLSLVRSISLLDIRFPCSVKNPAWFYGFGVYLGENSMKSPLTGGGGGRCFRAAFSKTFPGVHYCFLCSAAMLRVDTDDRSKVSRIWDNTFTSRRFRWLILAMRFYERDVGQIRFAMRIKVIG